MKILLMISLALLMCGGSVVAVCPTYDLTDDCKVGIDDLRALANGWITIYDIADFAALADQWLDNGAFVTTWDTSKGAAT